MSTPVYFTTIGLVLGTVLLIFAMRYLSATARAKAQMQDSAETAAQLKELNSRISRIESILKTVE